MNELQTIQDLYDRHLFLQAFQQSAAYWNAGTNLEHLSVDALILGGRLAGRLGGLRLSRWLLLAAATRDPTNPQVRYFAAHARRRGGHLLDILREFQRQPDLNSGDPELQASWFASHAVTWALLQDFNRAEACIERAHSFAAKDSWVLSCEADVLGIAHRWEEALIAAERAWEISPGAPYAARSLSNSLINLGRVEQSAQRLVVAAEKGESYEVAHLACWHLCALAETVDGDKRRWALDRALDLAKGLPTLAPLADREARSMFARTQLDIAEQLGHHDQMRRWAEDVRSPFHRRILENLQKNPHGRLIRLPFRRVIQKQDTCLPSSISAALAAVGVHFEADEIAADITFGGTPYWAAAEWLEKRGLAVRFFIVTPEVATALLQNGIAFVLGLESESNAHAVAAIGLDEAAGTVLIHDPNWFRTCEYLLEFIGEPEAPLGPKGLVAVPPNQAPLLDQLIPVADAEAMTAYFHHQRAVEKNGPAPAREIVAALAERQPRHPVTRYLQAVQMRNDGRTGEALAGFQHLFKEFPQCLRIREGLLWACRSLGNTALMRATLAGVVERGLLPGVQSTQDWRYPPATYLSQYADLLRMSAVSRRKASALLRTAIRQQNSSAEAWHVLGDLCWNDREPEGMLLAYRISSCLESNNEHYARAYCDALRDAGREEDGLSWLETRVRRFGAAPRAIGPWISWIATLEDYGHPERALAACDEAFKRDDSSSALLAFAVPFLARMGQWEQSEAGLRRLKADGHGSFYHEAAVAFHRMCGDLDAAFKLCNDWVREAPQAMLARGQCLELVAQREGRRAAADLAARWSAEHPGHDQLEELYYDRLETLSLGPEQDALLARRVKRNAEDGWAWRELAFLSLAEYQRADHGRREQLRPRIVKLLARCRRLAPEDPTTLRLTARWYEAHGRWQRAVAAWLKAIDREPESFYSYRRAWDCSAGLDAAGRRRVFQQIEPMLLRCVGRLAIARDMVFLLASRFGDAMAEEAAMRWKARRPDDPDVIEAAADLLLEYGQGRTDAERALAILEPATHRFPYHLGLRFSLAQACRALGKDIQAEETLQEIIRRHPGNTAACIQLAWIHERRGDGGSAQRLLTAAAAAAPLDLEVFRARAKILIRSGRLEDAGLVIREGLQRLPENVAWRETAIRLLFECGDEEGAIEAAREGVRGYPDGAYLWHLLADTLNQTRRLAAPGEIESCLRRALSFNAALFEAVDSLAGLLVEQHRYDEAEEVIKGVLPRLADSSMAGGRLAWVRRERGHKEEALEEMASVVRSAPWYRWGWDLLMDWLTEDQQWDQAQQLLSPIPAELRTDTHFRRRRLLVLEAAGVPAPQLDAEWDQLLQDFPEDVSLHLQRYDALREHQRLPEAAVVLHATRPVEPDSPFVLARLVEVLAAENQREEAMEALLRVWFVEVEESTWPAHYAWQAAQQARFEEAAYQRARRRLGEGSRPTLHAFSLMATHAKGLQSGGKRDPRHPWSAWFPGAGARELEALLAMVDRVSWADGRYRAILFACLLELGYDRLVVSYWKNKPAEAATDVTSWSQVGRALINSDQERKARKLLASWREHTGVEMWMVANYIQCFPRYRRSEYREIFAACHDALAGLSHDHCAKYLAHVQAEMSALLGDTEVFLETWTKYRGYFAGDLEEGEYFYQPRTHLLADIPCMGNLLELNNLTEFRKILRRWRLRNLLALMLTGKNEPLQDNTKLVWGGIILVWIILWLSKLIGK